MTMGVCGKVGGRTAGMGKRMAARAAQVERNPGTGRNAVIKKITIVKFRLPNEVYIALNSRFFRVPTRKL
jgi:hypothetical protein